MSAGRTAVLLLLCVVTSLLVIPAASAQDEPSRNEDRPRAARGDPPPRDREPSARPQSRTNSTPRLPDLWPPSSPPDHRSNRREPSPGAFRQGGPPHFAPGQPAPGLQLPGPPRNPLGMSSNDVRRLEELQRLDPEMYELEKANSTLR